MIEKVPEDKPEHYRPLALALMPQDQRPAYIERCFLRGEVSLGFAIRVCVGSGLPVPNRIAEAFDGAFWTYWAAGCNDLAEALGEYEPFAERKASLPSRTSRARVQEQVDRFFAEGYPKTSPDMAPVATAFDMAAEVLKLSPETVKSKYYRKVSDK